MDQGVTVGLKIRLLVGWLLAAIAVLLGLHLLSLAWLAHNDFVFDRWSWMFNLGSEKNLPTLFSFSLFGLCGLCLLLIGYAARITGERFRHHWSGLGLIFIFLGLDEALELHEALGKIVHAWLHTSGLFYFAWTLPYLLFVLVLAVIYIKFLLALPAVTRRWFITAAVVYLTGAVGMEILESALYTSCPAPCWPDWALVSIEETLEMLGLVVFLRGLLGYMANPARPYHVVLITGSNTRIARDPAADQRAHES